MALVVRMFNEKVTADGYKWEHSYRHAWEDLVDLHENDIKYQKGFILKSRKEHAEIFLKRTILRHIILLLDLSRCSNDTDFSPSRGRFILRHIKNFIIDCFDQNPLCQLGILILRDGITIKVIDLSEDLKGILECLDLIDFEGKGEASVQNALEVARSLLLTVPLHGTKEVLILFSSVSSSDAGNFQLLLKDLKNLKVRINCIALTGEIFLLKNLTKACHGDFQVSLHEDHFLSILSEYVTPPGSFLNGKHTLTYLIPIGFPKGNGNNDSSCLNYSGSCLMDKVFVCPRCCSNVCRIPSDCSTCGLTLLTSPYLAKSYHHLFPIAAFRSCSDINGVCYSCAIARVGQDLTQCQNCFNSFCRDCESFIHDSLFSCPGCVEI